MERQIAYLPVMDAALIAGLAGFYLGMSQCGGPVRPRGVAFAIAALSTLALSVAQLLMTRSKAKAAFTMGSGVLGYYVGGSLGWLFYIGPAAAGEALN